MLALLILLLILLPLYLWPLRGTGSGLPGAAALSRPPRDPRDAAAVAHLPADVWEGLMSEGASERHGEPSPKAPGNLTRIAQLDGKGTGPFDVGGGGLVPPGYDVLSRGHGINGLFGDGSDQSSGQSRGGEAPLEAVQFRAGPTSGESTGFRNGSGGGGSSGIPGLGPFAADPGAPEPTPEPTTILLVASNLALLAAAAWRRR